MLRIACPVAAVYLVLTVVLGPLFLTKNGWYYAASLPEAAANGGRISVDVAPRGVCLSETDLDSAA